LYGYWRDDIEVPPSPGEMIDNAIPPYARCFAKHFKMLGSTP
jgi:hypothetical protein